MFRTTILLLALIAAPAAALAKPVALVTEMTGTPPAHAGLFEEIEDGSLVTLPAGTEMTFVHYATCETVLARGGAIAFAASGWRSEGGSAAATAADCPASGDAVSGTQVGGVVLRSFGRAKGAVAAATRPAIALAGASASRVATVAIVTAAGEVWRGQPTALTGGWPGGLPPIDAEGGATVNLLDAAGATVATIRLVASASRAQGSLTIIRVE